MKLMAKILDPSPGCEDPAAGLKSSNPERYFSDPEKVATALSYLNENNLRSAIITAFNLPEDDDYVYHATASVTLAQVQSAVDAGTINGLCDWYLDDAGAPLPHPPPPDIAAYTTLFSPRIPSPSNALKSLHSNAKKDSLRAGIATNLLSKRYISPSFPAIPKPSKAAAKTPLFNPYLDFWIWSCHALCWAGPSANASSVHTSHAVLPVFMHHFGCVVPSREAVEVIRAVAGMGKGKGNLRTVLDIGSGTGYWSWILRNAGLSVVAVDNGQSTFRAAWVGDTVHKGGEPFLASRFGASDHVLLLVYPVVGGAFFAKMVEKFRGDWVVVAGTQCRNGFTAFREVLVDEWMVGEGKGWRLEVRVPLPSFAGKDEGLFVFRRVKDGGGGAGGEAVGG